MASGFTHEEAFLGRYLSLYPPAARRLTVGELPDRLVMDLVSYRWQTMDLVTTPVSVVMAVVATVVAGAWSPWAILLVALGAALPLALNYFVAERGAAGQNAVAEHEIARNAMVTEVLEAHDYYFLRGRYTEGRDRVLGTWESSRLGGIGRHLWWRALRLEGPQAGHSTSCVGER